MGLIHKDPYSYSPIGHVDSDGRIHSDPHSFSPIGHIDSDGLVHSDPHSFSPIGRVDSHGLVHSDPHSFSPIGHVDSDGLVHSDPYSFSPIGHVDPTSAKEGGAALLLLMKSSFYECSKCGSKGHSTADCPHGISSNRSSPRQETESYSSSSDENGCAKIIGWLVGIVAVVIAVIWLAVNIVLPVALLNSALALTILALYFKQRKTLFAILALVGGCYMLIDILNGWFSANFVKNVVKNPAWISGFVYINAVAIGLSSWLLVQPIWSNAKQIRASDKRKSIMLMSISIFLAAIATITIPAVYHSIQNPFARKFISGGKVTYDNAPVPFGNTESEQTETPPGLKHSEAKNVDELRSNIKIVTLISPTYTLGDLPHLTFKDVATNERQEYECDWSLPAIKEIATICENQDDCPALKGQAYNVTLELKLMDIMDFDPESGGMKPTGKKEKRWVIIAAKKISTPEKTTPTQNKRPFRDKPAMLSYAEVKAMLQRLDFYCGKWNEVSKEYSHPQGRGFANQFEKQQGGIVVLDRASGLMWQQSGSDNYMTYADAEKYIDGLNAREFAGYSDWRLPSLEDAMSLMEREKMNGNLYINPIFDSKQGSIWTVDKYSAGVVWVVLFDLGFCYGDLVGNSNLVRAVR